MRSTKKNPVKIDLTGSIQMFEGQWYRAGLRSPEVTECCSCGLVHITEYKVIDGKLFWRAGVDQEATDAAREREGISLRRKK